MRRLVPLLAAGVVCALVLTASAFSGASAHTSMGWKATLTARAEVPKQVVKRASAHGLFTASIVGGKLKWKLTYADLTGPATAAHIHMAAVGKPGNVIVPLCGGKPACKSGLTGTAPLTAQLRSWFKKHLLYVNVHTAKNPAGEIRGQLSIG